METNGEITLSQRLQGLHEASQVHKLSIGEMLERIGSKGFGILMLLLSMPAALPIPSPGYGTALGIAIAGLSIQMIIGRKKPWVPQRVSNLQLNQHFTQKMLASIIWFLQKIEHLVKPRLHFLCKRNTGVIIGILITLLAVLMIIPLPFTNTLPAMIIFMFGIALIESDGILSLAMIVFSTIVLAAYTYAFYILITLGIDGIIAIKNTLIEKMGF